MKKITTTAGQWLGPTCVMIVGAVLVAALLRPIGERSLIERGIAYTITTYDLVLPLIGLGVAALQMSRWEAVLVGVIFVCGVPIGLLSEQRLLAEGRVSIGLVRYAVFIGPLCCVVAALAVALTARAGAWVTPLAAALCGIALGFLVALHNPWAGDPRFSIGATIAGLWLISAAPALAHQLNRTWLKIGGRIFASWLVAIGLMVGGAEFVAMQRADRAAAEPSAPLSREPSGEFESGLDQNPILREWTDPFLQP